MPCINNLFLLGVILFDGRKSLGVSGCSTGTLRSFLQFDGGGGMRREDGFYTRVGLCVRA